MTPVSMPSMSICRPVVFIARDVMLDPLLARVGQQLSAQGHEVRFGAPPVPGQRQVFDVEQHAGAWADVDVALLSSRVRVSNALLAASGRLRAVVTPTIGMECIDIEAASGLGILVANGATEENFISMAEATVMTILMALYRPGWSAQVLQGERARPQSLADAMYARTLHARTVGLVGFGQIGRRVAERLRAFGVTLLLAQHPSLDPATLAPDIVVTPLAELLQASDIVSLHAGARAGQPPLLGAAELALMKPDAVLINTARGSLVDEAALYRALASRAIAGAVLDTFQVEPLPADSPLRALDNVTLTPHLVGHTQEMFASLEATAQANIDDVLAGRVPACCVNREAIRAWRVRRDSA